MVITARIRRMGEGNIFSLFTLAGEGIPHLRFEVGGYPISGLGGVPHPMSGGYPISGLGRGVPHLRSRVVPISGLGWYPSQVWGVPHLQGGTPCLGGYPMCGGYPMSGGVPHLWPPIAQSSIASTSYAAGGVPLAFTQEDFLVFILFWLEFWLSRAMVWVGINLGRTVFVGSPRPAILQFHWLRN